MQELFGEHNFNFEDSKTVKVELEKYFNSTKKKTKKMKLGTQNLLLLSFI